MELSRGSGMRSGGPELKVAAADLPGALVLLQEVGEYGRVIALGTQVRMSRCKRGMAVAGFAHCTPVHPAAAPPGRTQASPAWRLAQPLRECMLPLCLPFLVPALSSFTAFCQRWSVRSTPSLCPPAPQWLRTQGSQGDSLEAADVATVTALSFCDRAAAALHGAGPSQPLPQPQPQAQLAQGSFITVCEDLEAALALTRRCGWRECAGVGR